MTSRTILPGTTAVAMCATSSRISRLAPGIPAGTLPITEAVDVLVDHGYAGSIGCEYQPNEATVDTLGWVD